MRIHVMDIGRDINVALEGDARVDLEDVQRIDIEALWTDAGDEPYPTYSRDIVITTASGVVRIRVSADEPNGVEEVYLAPEEA